MNNTNSQNAVHALLQEYEKAIAELQNTIRDIPNPDLQFPIDPHTQNPDCTSIQMILAHVVSSGYSYASYVRALQNKNTQRPEKTNRESASEYVADLNQVIQFTRDTFAGIRDAELEEFDSGKKIHTNWGQLYDIEQMMEHAIVHILRHRRQIERFKVILQFEKTTP
ncbi:DinB family protein [Flavobacterium humi]|uniref:DinB family protein n=1 Tax=Flavobacterium humi TaxID=2562683 RepID=A0A4Z0LBU9_9FLAO|nr:DinB family protein [Flavobacterium humi]TGD59362.1 DinB family protein [Flavobacterium humi]